MENQSENKKEYHYSEFQQKRQKYKPQLCKTFTSQGNLSFKNTPIHIDEKIAALFPALMKNSPSFLEVSVDGSTELKLTSPLRIAVVLSGGQAAGGHNVISGVFDFLKQYNSHSQLFGFLGGPEGIYKGKVVEIDEKLMEKYRNQGGFDMICSGRHKIETPQQFKDSLYHCTNLKLDGLIVIGGDDSNTNACLLADYFSQNQSNIRVIGVPKTIDGDLKNEWIEVSFGFDTATRVYAEQIGNISIDTLSSKKYYHFIRLMGRSASHIALECGLLTQINYVIIGEEVEKKKQKLKEIVNDLSEIIITRSNLGKDYGVVLVPEGLIEFIPEVNVLIKEINEILAHQFEGDPTSFVQSKLTEESLSLFNFLPKSIRDQLLLDRDPHGNVQVSKIDTERLLILLIQKELSELKSQGKYSGKFTPISHFFGYEGRCALPSVFDSEYCYNLGFNAGLLISENYSGYMSVIRNLSSPNPQEWIPSGCPLTSMMNVERRKGKDVPVIKKALVDLDGDVFKSYEYVRKTWSLNDSYIVPGPIQFEGECSKTCPFLVKGPNFRTRDLSEFNVSWKGDPKKKPYSERSLDNLSGLSKQLLKEKIKLPKVLESGKYHLKYSTLLESLSEESKISSSKFYPNIYLNTSKYKFLAEIVDFEDDSVIELEKRRQSFQSAHNNSLRIGIVYCGRQSPGGNNVINGLLEFKKQQLLKEKIDVQIFGFVFGTAGLFKGDYIEIDEDNFAPFRNHGGYDFLGRSADKIRTPKELEAAKESCLKLNLDSLILVGATHTLTDALILTEYFISHSIKVSVLAVPCTVDGNIVHPLFESTIGFDTASKVYSQFIGNSMTDAASATKYWYLMRLMGRDPSFLVLEAALQTNPNYVIISEECADKGETLDDIVNEICDVIAERAAKKCNFGTILIPEGLLNHLPHFRILIEELNEVLLKNQNDEEVALKLLNDENFLREKLSSWSSAVFLDLPDFFKKQLLIERESHGTIQLSQIETERLLGYKIQKELEKRKKLNKYSGSFAYITHFFGYQGRCAFPTMFDNTLATTYGFIAGVLSRYNVSGYCVTARGLSGPVEKWKVAGIPLISMTSVKGKSQYGDNRPVIASGFVDVNSKVFNHFKSIRKDWVFGNIYSNPGPIQFNSIIEISKILKHEHGNYNDYLQKIEEYCEKIKSSCRFGAHEDKLRAAVYGLECIDKILGVIKKN